MRLAVPLFVPRAAVSRGGPHTQPWLWLLVVVVMVSFPPLVGPDAFRSAAASTTASAAPLARPQQQPVRPHRQLRSRMSHLRCLLESGRQRVKYRFADFLPPPIWGRPGFFLGIMRVISKASWPRALSCQETAAVRSVCPCRCHTGRHARYQRSAPFSLNVCSAAAPPEGSLRVPSTPRLRPGTTVTRAPVRHVRPPASAAPTPA